MRPSWTEFFLDLATVYATRATCNRLHVGCLLVVENRVVAAGYNGSPPGLPHCDQVGHEYDAFHSCQRTIHAEANAVAQAAALGARVNLATAYLTHSPCYTCAKLLISAGIWEIVYQTPYSFDDRIQELCRDGHVLLHQYPEPVISLIVEPFERRG